MIHAGPSDLSDYLKTSVPRPYGRGSCVTALRAETKAMRSVPGAVATGLVEARSAAIE